MGPVQFDETWEAICRLASSHMGRRILFSLPRTCLRGEERHKSEDQ